MKQIIFKRATSDFILEVHQNMFKDDKVVISIQRNRDGKKVSKTSFFLDIEDACYIKKKIDDGRFFKELEEYTKHAAEKKLPWAELKHLNPCENQGGGMVGDTLMSRIFRFKSSKNKDYCCCIEIIESVGRKQGILIVPTKEKLVRHEFPFTRKDLELMFDTIFNRYQAFTTFKYSFMTKEFFYSKDDFKDENVRNSKK